MNTYKKLFPYLIYAVLMLLFAFGEKVLLGHYFSLGFMLALSLKRKNLLIVLPVYAVAVAVAQWSLSGLLYAFLPPVVVCLSNFIFYKIKKTPNAPFYCIAATIVSLTSFLFVDYSIPSLIRASLSVVASVLTFNATSVAITAIETRGAKWKLSNLEWLSICLFLILVIIATTPIEVSAFPVLPIVATFIISLSIAAGPPTALVVGGIVGLASSLISLEFSMIALYFVFAIGVVLGKAHPALSAFVATTFFIGIDYLITRQILYLEWIGAGTGSILCIALYKILAPRFHNVAECQSKSQSHRFLINRTRQEVANKLYCLSSVFKDMEEVLNMSKGNQSNISTDKIVNIVQSENCALCTKKEYCEKSFGNSMSLLIAEMVHSSTERGQASILDTPAFLSANCSRLSSLIDSINWHIKEQKVLDTKDRNNQLIKSMMSRQMGGVGDILKELSDDVSAPVLYDSLVEKKLVLQLNYQNVLATDAIVSQAKLGRCLTLLLAEEPLDETELRATINRVLGTRMDEIRREKNVMGGVTICYETAPKYTVAYGEYGLSLKDNEKSGDNIEAAHISKNKVMIVLSDGMGSGRAAYETSRLAIDLLTSFYKAGFSHNTVLYSSSRLLTLKNEEEFNAVDLALVDLYDGGVDFIKLGGREGYIKTLSGVEVVPCGSLPLGIVDEIAPVITRKNLNDGDYFVMVSDGVADILDREQIETILTAIVSTNPNTIAREIVENALRVGGKKDDMSCVVGRIFLSI